MEEIRGYVIIKKTERKIEETWYPPNELNALKEAFNLDFKNPQTLIEVFSTTQTAISFFFEKNKPEKNLELIWSNKR